jgi:hypothetical protein
VTEIGDNPAHSQSEIRNPATSPRSTPPNSVLLLEEDDEGEAEGGYDGDDSGDEGSNLYTEEEYELDELDDGEGDSSDDESASTWSNRSHFTEIQRIDLDKQAQGNWNYRHGHLYYLGSIWDVRSRRRECDLCHRLWYQTRKNPDIKDEYLTKSRCILKIMELKGRRSNQQDKEVVMLNLVYMYGYKLDDPREGQWIMRMALVIQGVHRDTYAQHEKIPADQIIPFNDRLFGEARWRNDECNYVLLREWLRTCETKHKHPSPELVGDIAIRLIDVQQRRLIEWQGPVSQVPRFVALSYVWGKAQQMVLLTKNRLSEFKQPGFFNQRLDQTIHDALEVVARIGEVYIWIDALCILQDSPADKGIQIPQMHQIYGSAVLTIVAAHGDSADAGLPGVAPQSRTGNRFTLDLPDIRILFRGRTKMYVAENSLDIGFTENYIYSSMYQSRAWTFQEGHLSTRALIFTKDQVYFECEKSTWCEETHWESESMDFLGWRAIYDPTPHDVWKDRFDRRAYDLATADEDTSEPQRNSYATLIKAYSQRELTHDTDILDACTGVLSIIQKREQSEFFFGLRTRYFGNDLLFNILSAGPRRFPDQGESQTGSKARFPTWSWTSWKGLIEIANEARNNSYDSVENLVPCDGVKCHTVYVDQNGKTCLRVINENGGWRFEKGYVRRGEGIYDPAELTMSATKSSVSEEGSNESNIPKNVAASSKDTAADIPIYLQNLALSSISSHPAFPQILPGFHIIFATFSSLVVVKTEYDELSIMLSGIVIGGTKKTRGGSLWQNRDPIQRKLYVCRKIINEAEEEILTNHSRNTGEASCPCCNRDNTLTPNPFPPGLEQGPYLGRLPAFSKSWYPEGYLESIPDGVYKLLWMNNNQLPMFGHLLCKPVSASASKDGSNWDGEILQRVSGVLGPTDILEREQQEKYGAEWGTHILG